MSLESELDGSQQEASNHKSSPLENAEQHSPTPQFEYVLPPLRKKARTMRPITFPVSYNSFKFRSESLRPNTSSTPNRPEVGRNSRENESNRRRKFRRLSNHRGKTLAELIRSGEIENYDSKPGIARYEDSSSCEDDDCSLNNGLKVLERAPQPASVEDSVPVEKTDNAIEKNEVSILTDANQIPKKDKPKLIKKSSLDVSTQTSTTDLTEARNEITKSKDLNANEERQQRNEIGTIMLWIDFYVYCDPKFTTEELVIICDGMCRLQEILPNVNFGYLDSKPRIELDYIWMKKGARKSGLNSFVGRRGGAQIVHVECLGCMEVDVIHEMVRALGLAHEHQRPDRNRHINIIWRNIEEGKKSDFEKLPASKFPTLAFGFPYDEYDIKSITHYASKDFTKNRLATISNKNRKLFPRRVELTNLDILKLQAIYGCVDMKILKAVLKRYTRLYGYSYELH